MQGEYFRKIRQFFILPILYILSKMQIRTCELAEGAAQWTGIMLNEENESMLNARDLQPEAIVSYVEQLVNIPSPTGYTADLEQYLLENAQKKQIACKQTRKGAVMYLFETSEPSSHIMFAAHVDTLGAIVKEVKRETVTLSLIGSSPPMYLVGDYCRIHTFDGEVYEGTILPQNPAAHVNKNLREMEITGEDLRVRVDLPLQDTSAHLDQYLDVGNFITLDPKFRHVNGFVKSRHLDDKASAAVLLHVADLLKQAQEKLTSNVYFFFNTTEETGQGMSGFPPIDDLIVVDMGVVGDGVAGNEYDVSICAKDSSGPYNYALTQQLVRLCKDQKIGYKTDIFPYYSSDGSAALRAGNDLRVALIGPGVSASHGYERTHVASLENTGKLMLAFLAEACLEA